MGNGRKGREGKGREESEREGKGKGHSNPPQKVWLRAWYVFCLLVVLVKLSLLAK